MAAYPLQKTEEEWEAELSPEAYRVLRENGTEPAFDNEFHDNHDAGVYRCGACEQELFNSETKYDSGSGWPSFYEANDGATGVVGDASHGMVRDEVVCSRCGSHLGHVFEDGPEPTGLRYCMNSAALKFEPKSV